MKTRIVARKKQLLETSTQVLCALLTLDGYRSEHGSLRLRYKNSKSKATEIAAIEDAVGIANELIEKVMK